MMKRTLCSVMLLCIAWHCFAQVNSNTNRTFELPLNFAERRFFIDLGNGNMLQVELKDMTDLNRFLNMDSVLREFFKDIEPLKDSLSNELTSKRIDYRSDAGSARKIRFQQYQPDGSSFAVGDNDVAALKLEQDTVNFIGTVPYIAKYGFRKPFETERHYKVSFFVNQLDDLRSYMDGSINHKLQTLQQNINSTWITTEKKGAAYLKDDKSISARLTKGYISGGDFLTMRISVDAQNYKSYFVPSFSLGAGLILSKANWKREFVLSWEPNFFFNKDADGKLRTFRNDFLTLTAAQGAVRDNEPRKESHFITILSFSYLVNRNGDYFEKGTMRLGAGRLSLFEGKVKIEPAIYFTDLFKKVTPGLRWIQSF